jgi:hypothetical protein
MKRMRYMRGAGRAANLFAFWLCYCQMYVVGSLLSFAVAWLGHPLTNNNIAITALGAAIGGFFLTEVLYALLKALWFPFKIIGSTLSQNSVKTPSTK